MSRAKIPLSLLVMLAVITPILVLAGCGKDKEYQLSTSSVPNGAGTVSPSGGIFKGEVTLVATPAKYHRFSGWGGAAQGNSNPLTLKMNSNKQVVAQFTRMTGNLQVQMNPTGGGTVYPGTGSFDAGTQVTITATPAKGYRFDHWEGDITGTSNSASILVDGNKTATAYFVRQYNLNISRDPADGGSVVPGSGLYDAGKPVSLTPIPSFGYYPKTWIGTDNNNVFPTTVPMNNDTSVTIVFAQSTKGELQRAAGEVSKDANGRWGPIASVPIQLNQFDWIQGEILLQTPNTPNTPVRAYIQDPAGKIVKDFGSSRQANFNFMAQTTGRYTVVFQNDSIWYADYHLTYTLWTKRG